MTSWLLITVDFRILQNKVIFDHNSERTRNFISIIQKFPCCTTNLPITDDLLIQNLEDVVTYATKHLKKQKPLIIWGTSLGTAVSSAAMHYSPKVHNETNLLILDGAFDSFSKMVHGEHYAAVIFSKFYGALWNLVIDKITSSNKIGYKLESSENLKNFQKPVIIAHAEDDDIIPIVSGERLYDGLTTKRKTFLRVNGNEGVGHMGMVSMKTGEIDQLIREVLKNDS